MAFSAALLAKGLAGVGAVSLVATGLIFLSNDSNKEINKKIEKLGIDESCYFKDNSTHKTCTLDKTKLEKVKFEKTGGTFDSASASLTITKVTGVEAEGFEDNLKFTLKNTSTGTSTDITIGSSNDTIILKPGVSYDFKIKKDGENLKLEKAWTIETLGNKVGLSCSSGDNATSCTIKTEGINVWKDNSGVTNATTTETSKQVSVTKDTKDYNQGLKFTVSEDINLTVSGGNSGGIDKLTQTSTNNTSYEIALKDHKGTKTWFLVEKSTPASSVPQESQ